MKKLLLILSLVCLFGVATRASADPLLPFGGIVSITTPCTCSPGLLYIWFTPLYITGAPISGPMVYSPYTSILYADFNIGIPGTWHLGTYLPTPGAPICWVVAGPTCAPLPAIGLITTVGTNRLF
jgi:hypothetical protein